MTLDEDVARALARRAAETQRSFKETVNDVLRRGLRADPGEVTFEVTTFSSPIRPGLDLTKALALASSLEDDEILRKIELGK